MNAIAPLLRAKKMPESAKAPGETLYERVDELIRSHKGQLLSSMGSRAVLVELAARSEGLERAIREVALEVQRLAASRRDL